jgi:hypothetical protein
MSRDLLDWIRNELAACQPAALDAVEPVLRRARLTYGGDRVYVRAPAGKPSYRTMQRRQQIERRVSP